MNVAVQATNASPVLRTRRQGTRGLILTPSGIIGLSIMTAIVLATVLAPWISPYDPVQQDINQRLRPPLWVNEAGGRHFLGTDQLGRDVLSRLIYGSRVSLVVGFTAVPLSALIGTLVGVVSGYTSGLVDEVLMRLVDIQLAIPFILLALAVMAVLGPNLLNLIIVLAVTTWVHFAKLIRGEVLSVRERDFVVAALALGASHARIMRLHILPSIVSSITVLTTLNLPRTIITEAGVSFLGLGIQPPTPSWGGMLSEGQEYVWTAWWLSTLAGLAISITVLGANLLGDWVRDALDPRIRTRARI